MECNDHNFETSGGKFLRSLWVSCTLSSLFLSYPSDDGIVGGRHFVEDAIDTHQTLLVLDRDAVVLFVVVFQFSAHQPRGMNTR